MHAPQLGAAMEHGEHLAGIEQALGVEGAFQALLLGEIGLVEHLAHEVALFDAHAMLARQHAAHGDAEPQDIGAEGLGRLQLARLVGVIEDQRMKVAVAGVEHVGDAEPAGPRHLLHLRQHLRQAPARDGAVHAVVVGRDAAYRRKGRLAPGPEALAFGLVPAGPDGLATRKPWRSVRPAGSARPPPPPARRARRSAALPRRAGSPHGRSPRPPGSPAGPSSPCRRE